MRQKLLHTPRASRNWSDIQWKWMLLPQHSHFLSSERCTVNAQQHGWEQERATENDRDSDNGRKSEWVQNKKKIPYERRVTNTHDINSSLWTPLHPTTKKKNLIFSVSFLNFEHTDEKILILFCKRHSWRILCIFSVTKATRSAAVSIESKWNADVFHFSVKFNSICKLLCLFFLLAHACYFRTLNSKP